MPRKALIDSRELPYHITARANNRERFPGELEFVWKVMTDELQIQSHLHGLRIHAFVLMPNHFHLLATSPEVQLPVIMREFIGATTRILNARNERWGRIFGARYHWCLIRDASYYAHALKYVYRNPIRAGICVRVCEYPYSTISLLTGSGFLPLSVLPPLRNFDFLIQQTLESPSDLESWLNEPSRTEEETAIRKALRRREFYLTVDRETRRQVELSASI